MVHYKTTDDFFRNTRPFKVGERVGRQLYVESLLAVYSSEYVQSCFGIPRSEVQATLERCNPVAERRRELEHMAGVAELMSMVVGAEGPLD